MKRFFLICAIITIAASCKKDTEISNLKKDIAGKWELEQVICFYCPPYNGAYPPGNGKIIVISGNGNFERRQHDTVVFKGSYTIRKGSECNPDEYLFNTPEPSTYSVSIESGKLQLSTISCVADGGTNIYRKIE